MAQALIRAEESRDEAIVYLQQREAEMTRSGLRPSLTTTIRGFYLT